VLPTITPQRLTMAGMMMEGPCALAYHDLVRRDPADTKERILRAAAAEFAERGIAGARVDRIVEAAGTGKGLIYNYFGSKEKLFDAVHNALTDETMGNVPFDPANLGEYAAALYDHNQDNPAAVRLTYWFRLERGDAQLPESAVASHARKVAAVKEAQAAGVVNADIPAEELLDSLLAIALGGLPEPAKPTPAARRARRQAIVRVVERIAAP
jgi:AcrR family transcriptional regulator